MSVTPRSLIIVGAGFAGLALAAHLRKRNFDDFLLLEKGTNVGGFWSGNYDRMRIHSPYHDLPGDGGLRRRYGVFLSRDEVLQYFRDYARVRDVIPRARFGVDVERVARDGDCWRLETNAETFEARYLALATSFNRVPLVPVFSGARGFSGHLLHSRQYKEPSPFRDKRVLVVGSGNSAAEISLDVAEGGARSVSMLVRGPRHFTSMRTLGRVAPILRALRLEFCDSAWDKGHRYTRTHPDFRKIVRKNEAPLSPLLHDLSAFGIQKPKDGLFTEMLCRGRVGVADQGVIPLIRSGRVAVVNGNERPLEEFTERGVRLGGEEIFFDAVVLATGFQPGLEDLLAEPQRFLAQNSTLHRLMPITDGRCRSTVEPSLFFPGLEYTANGGHSLGRWGIEAAEYISAEIAGREPVLPWA
jgi:indole-3-pyruvate monooxygenase